MAIPATRVATEGDDALQSDQWAIPTPPQIDAYLASPSAQAAFRDLRDDWRCPSCDRSKREVVRYDSGGRLYARLVMHHDHLTDNDPMATARFEPTGVCSDCNDVDARVKGANPALRYDWSLHPSVIRRFIVARPHRNHGIDRPSVEMFARSMIEVYGPPMMASHPRHVAITPETKLIAVTWAESLTAAAQPIGCETVFQASRDLYTMPTKHVPPQFIGRRSSWEREGLRWLVPWSARAEKELRFLVASMAGDAGRLLQMMDWAGLPGVLKR